MDMVRFLHGGGVAVPLQHGAHALHGGEQGVHPEGEIGRIDQRRPGLLKGAEHIGLDVVPAGRPHDGRFEMPGDESVIGLEGVRPGKVDDHALLCDLRVHAANILAGLCEFDPPLGQFLFHHMAHPAVSADDDFHIVFRKLLSCSVLLKPLCVVLHKALSVIGWFSRRWRKHSFGGGRQEPIPFPAPCYKARGTALRPSPTR